MCKVMVAVLLLSSCVGNVESIPDEIKPSETIVLLLMLEVAATRPQTAHLRQVHFRTRPCRQVPLQGV